MTDDTGMLQHAIFSIPRYEDGYCLDDNARALLLMAQLEDAGSDDPVTVRTLAARYLAFVNYAFDRPAGRFRNFLSYSRQWMEAAGSEDSHGRAVWALGAVVGRSVDPGRRTLGSDLFYAALPALGSFTSPRAWAYGLLGIDEYLRAFQGDSTVEAHRVDLAGRLLGLFQRTSEGDWRWFEDSVTYCNARLSQALIVSGDRMGRRDMVDAGLQSLTWLMSLQSSPDRQFAGVGSNGFYVRGATPAAFDQQPVEACATVSACLDAFRVRLDPQWATHARHVFNWFLGENHLQHWLFDASTGGCRDGLHEDRANQNQGAEATLSFLHALHGVRAVEALDPTTSPSSTQLLQTT
jgi:hypothetical protein